MKKLFEFTKVLFENPKEYNDVSDYEKKRHFFMVSRFMGIQYPLQAHLLNHIKINAAETINFWHRFLRKQYNRVPFWMYTKGVKKSKKDKEKKIKVSDSLVEEYARVNKIDKNLVYEAFEHFPKEISAELKDFKKVIE